MKRTLTSAPAPPPAAPDCLPALGRLLRELLEPRHTNADARAITLAVAKSLIDRAHGRDAEWLCDSPGVNAAVARILGSK